MWMTSEHAVVLILANIRKSMPENEFSYLFTKRVRMTLIRTCIVKVLYTQDFKLAD